MRRGKVALVNAHPNTGFLAAGGAAEAPPPAPPLVATLLVGHITCIKEAMASRNPQLPQ
jgi:hypothetical protein